MWNVKGLGKLASFIGIPLLLDMQTASRYEMTYARVCVEVSIESDLPSNINYMVENTRIKVPIEYSWKPLTCSHCVVFGHSTEKCDVVVVSASKVAAEARAAKKITKPSKEKEKPISGNEGWLRV